MTPPPAPLPLKRVNDEGNPAASCKRGTDLGDFPTTIEDSIGNGETSAIHSKENFCRFGVPARLGIVKFRRIAGAAMLVYAI